MTSTVLFSCSWQLTSSSPAQPAAAACSDISHPTFNIHVANSHPSAHCCLALLIHPFPALFPCSFLKNIQITKPGLTLGSANVTLPMLSPQVALKLAQLGFNVPTAELGLKKANINAALPVPDLSLAQKAVNLTVPFPDVGMKQFGVNLTVPDIQLPRLEVNVSGMPRVSHAG